MHASASVIRTVPRRRPALGFTLIEMMVVLVILAIMIAMVRISFFQDEKRVLAEEGERLAALLQQAQDDAFLTGRPIGWSLDAAGYKFWRVNDDAEWSGIADDEVYRPRTLPASVRIKQISVNQTPLKEEELLVFSPGGVGTPFEAELALNQARLSVVGDAMGRVRIAAGGER